MPVGPGGQRGQTPPLWTLQAVKLSPLSLGHPSTLEYGYESPGFLGFWGGWCDQTYRATALLAHREGRGVSPRKAMKLPPTLTALIPGVGGGATVRSGEGLAIVKWRVGEAAI